MMKPCGADRPGASDVRVTVQFRSDRGNEYLYDDVTGAIFPWSAVRERVLSLDLARALAGQRMALDARFGSREVEAAHRLITSWRSRYGAFSRPASATETDPPLRAEDVERHVRDNAFELLLVLTENCNLRCRYCALSPAYPLNRVRTARRMTVDTAKRAVDWYVALVQPQRMKNPRRRFGLSLYGGEPLLNRPVLAAVLDHCRATYPRTFVPVLTTNGTLLTRRNVELLVEHEVMIGISIDGPAPEHDRLRVDPRGRGTLERIASNLAMIREAFPDYWATKVTAVSVYDWGTDLEAITAFFAEHADALPRSIFVNQVGGHNTDWYSRYEPRDARRMAAALGRLRERYKRAKVRGDVVPSYLECLVGMPIALVGLRRRVLDAAPRLMPWSGACVPGTKVAVHVDGKIDVCERVNGTYPIGHLDHGGIDYERVLDILTRYRRDVLPACSGCAVARQCQLCFSHVEGRDCFRQDPELCAGIRADVARRMADYVSILEENPKADFRFETDTARLEERMLLLC